MKGDRDVVLTEHVNLAHCTSPKIASMHVFRSCAIGMTAIEEAIFQLESGAPGSQLIEYLKQQQARINALIGIVL